MLWLLNGTLQCQEKAVVWLSNNFQELNQGIRALRYVRINSISTFCELLFSLFVCSECMWNMSSKEDVISVKSHLCSWSKVDAVQILPAETVGWWGYWGSRRVNQVMVYHIPSEVKAKCSWEAVDKGTEQKRLSQICDSRKFTSC